MEKTIQKKSDPDNLHRKELEAAQDYLSDPRHQPRADAHLAYR